MSNESRPETIRELARRLRQFERAQVERPAATEWSTGWPALDRILPDQSLRAGCLIEWLQVGIGSGATSLVVRILDRVLAVELNRLGQHSDAPSKSRLRGVVAHRRPDRFPHPAIVIVDRNQQFSAAGVDVSHQLWSHLIVIQPATDADALWAWEQSLRCSGVLGAVFWGDAVSDRILRRVKLAVESGTGVGMLIRDHRWLRATSWADVRLGVRTVAASEGHPSQQRTCEIRLLAGRGETQLGATARVSWSEAEQSSAERRA